MRSETLEKKIDRHNPEHYSTSLRMQPNNGRLLEALAKRLGVPKNTVVVMGLHLLAKENGVPIAQEAETDGR